MFEHFGRHGTDDFGIDPQPRGAAKPGLPVFPQYQANLAYGHAQQ
jgi:hypothetical protein